MKKEFRRTIFSVIIIIVIFITPLVLFIYSESQQVTYIGEVVELEVRQMKESNKDLFLVFVRLDSGDSRVFNIKGNESFEFFRLKVGQRYNFCVKPAKDINLEYTGVIDYFNELAKNNIMYESTG